jgi:DNA-binding NarL/FixJ family response regulator
MLVLQANLIVTDPAARSHILESISSVQPPVLAKPFESHTHLSQYLLQCKTLKRQILVTDQTTDIAVLNQTGHFMATILLGESLTQSPSAVVSISKLPNSEELVDAIQTTYRVADQFFRLQSNANNVTKLADRERRIIELAAEGTPNKAIATRLGISIKTVEKNRRNAYQKLNVTSTAEMASLVTFNRFCIFPPPPISNPTCQ